MATTPQPPTVIHAGREIACLPFTREFWRVAMERMRLAKTPWPDHGGTVVVLLFTVFVLVGADELIRIVKLSDSEMEVALAEFVKTTSKHVLDPIAAYLLAMSESTNQFTQCP